MSASSVAVAGPVPSSITETRYFISGHLLQVSGAPRGRRSPLLRTPCPDRTPTPDFFQARPHVVQGIAAPLRSSSSARRGGSTRVPRRRPRRARADGRAPRRGDACGHAFVALQRAEQLQARPRAVDHRQRDRAVQRDDRPRRHVRARRRARGSAASRSPPRSAPRRARPRSRPGAGTGRAAPLPSVA